RHLSRIFINGSMPRKSRPSCSPWHSNCTARAWRPPKTPPSVTCFSRKRDLAVKALRPEMALGAIDALGQTFAVKALDMKVAALTKIGKAARTSTARRLVVEAAILVVDEAVASDHYQAAGRLSELAQEMAAQIKSKTLTALVKDHAREL